MYEFTPMTEEELEKSMLLEEGNYNFVVKSSERKISKSGNPMCQLILDIYDHDGHIRNVYDYLVFSPQNLCIRKVRHFCIAVGLEEEYKKGKLDEDFTNLSGSLTIGVQDRQEKPGGGFYEAKNIVLDYMKSEKKMILESKSSAKEADFHDDDVPF